MGIFCGPMTSAPREPRIASGCMLLFSCHSKPLGSSLAGATVELAGSTEETEGGRRAADALESATEEAETAEEAAGAFDIAADAADCAAGAALAQRAAANKAQPTSRDGERASMANEVQRALG